MIVLVVATNKEIYLNSYNCKLKINQYKHRNSSKLQYLQICWDNAITKLWEGEFHPKNSRFHVPLIDIATRFKKEVPFILHFDPRM